ncbi:MAG TPA: L-2-hydroxyglutarate oxidase [Ornithinibacter sp.]|nr:L-2-hydroxyglutarate oxidase [Ornithinibacter sp.]
MTGARRVVVVGGGIVGLAVADRVLRTDPSAAVTVLEKEHDWARHQSGRNSGVLHSGLYYPPRSLKARWCRAGADAMVAFVREEGLPHRVTGKLVVATEPAELAGLAALHERGLANGLAVTRLTADEAREHEPHVAALAALHVAETGVVDYHSVCAALVGRLRDGGARLVPGTEVVRGWDGAREVVLETNGGEVVADAVVVCAGLHADRVARLLGHRPSVRIVPFRGEYRTLTPDAAPLVRGLVYPVPDPRFPFLGVHLTRGIDDEVHAGPNAVLALSREGYTWGDVSPADLAGTLSYAGFWRLARRHHRSGAAEMVRSLSARRFTRSVQRLVPELRGEDLVPAPAGVRAQAVRPDGSLVDDFLVERHGRVVHLLNAPSPAATASLEIARHVEALLPR